MKRAFSIVIGALAFLAAGEGVVCAQSVYGLISQAREYRASYNYEKAITYYELAKSSVQDSLLHFELSMEQKACDGAFNSTRQVALPSVVSRARFSKDDFFLYYPLPDGAFRPVENAAPMFYTGDEDSLCVSRNAGEQMLFPMTIGDRMYFSAQSSDGLGGYDLYYADWDDMLGEWGEAVNLGFPYSSAADDFLYMETEDGMFEIFASNRGCSSDSVYVYVIDKNASLSYSSEPTPADLEAMAELNPNMSSLLSMSSPSDNSGINPWAEKYELIIERERELLAQVNIVSSEQRPAYKAELDEVQAEKARIEKHIFDHNSEAGDISKDVEREVAGVDGSFIFIKKNLGKPLKVTYIEN